MAVFEASISTDGNLADAIRCLRQLTARSVSDIRERLNTDSPIVAWDTDEYPIEMEREKYNAQMMRQVDGLVDAGLHIKFQYRPAAGDPASPIELDAIRELLAWEVDYDNQARD